MDQSLKHHGVLGMKWGIRRYQPYPQDYTGKGKFKGKKATAPKPTLSSKKAAPSTASKTTPATPGVTKTTLGKPIKQVSDAQLKTAINRIRMEKEYAQLTAKEKHKGQKFVEDVLVTSAKTVATQYVTKQLSNLIMGQPSQPNAQKKGAPNNAAPKQKHTRPSQGPKKTGGMKEAADAMKGFKKHASDIQDVLDFINTPTPKTPDRNPYSKTTNTSSVIKQIDEILLLPPPRK